MKLDLARATPTIASEDWHRISTYPILATFPNISSCFSQNQRGDMPGIVSADRFRLPGSENPRFA
jgi:hypothetical protein